MGGLPDKPVCTLSKRQMGEFRELIGWEGDGWEVPYPTPGERAVRRKREAWKRKRAGMGRTEPCLLYKAENIRTLKRNVRTDRKTEEWFERLTSVADRVSALPMETFSRLIEAQGPWSGHGMFCPNCVDRKSPQSVHLRFWKWRVDDMERIRCPYCGIVYPDSGYPEEGRIDLPRLGLTYRFWLSPEEQAAADWRLGEKARQFAGFPIHASISGEIRSTKLNWALGQVEPLGIAFALTGRARYARVVEAILLRMAEVYHRYPMYSYIQDFVDADPGYATENPERIETAFKKNAFLPSYTGVVGERQGVFGQNATTPFETRVASGAWGCTRTAREKSSTGQLFMSLFKGYDLAKSALSGESRRQIEQGFLLEYYLDVKALSWRIDNKQGPGATARAAVGVFYDDEEELAEGVDHFHRVIESQFYADGSAKEAPIYAAKPVYENLWELPEIVRDRVDLYAGSAYGKGLRMFADIATPLGTQPSVDDSPASYSLPNTIVDLARIRLGVSMSSGPRNFSGFDLTDARRVEGSSFYVATPDQLPKRTATGFHAVGFEKRYAGKRSAVSMFNERLPAGRRAVLRQATNRYYADRGLACLGYGRGANAVQLYLVGEDGRTGHRHNGPLSILLFAGGREVFPDLGYIADHPANAWIRSTPSHNTVTVDERSIRATGPGVVSAFHPDGPLRSVDVTVPVEGLDRYRRCVNLIEKRDGLPVIVDVFDVAGGRVHDYQIRVNDPEHRFSVRPGKFLPRIRGLFPDQSAFPLAGFRTAGRATGPVTAAWGRSARVVARVLAGCDELITYGTPAWRDFREVFTASEKTFETLVLRNRGKTSRYVVVYELCDGRSALSQVALADVGGVSTIRVRERGGVDHTVMVGG